MNNMLNSKLFELLAGVDKKKLEQVSSLVRNMSPEDLANLTNMIGINNSNTSNNDKK